MIDNQNDKAKMGTDYAGYWQDFANILRDCSKPHTPSLNAIWTRIDCAILARIVTMPCVNRKYRSGET